MAALRLPIIRLGSLALFLWCGVGATTLQAQAERETRGPEAGALYISGGGKLDLAEFVELVRRTTKQTSPIIRVMTTSQGKRRQAEIEQGKEFRLLTSLQAKFGLKQSTELFTLSKKAANTPEFYGAIDDADAVFMAGGNQCYFTDVFLETETLAALRRLLARGGVIGGSSAGAQVQSSFMTRGDYGKRVILGDGKHQSGFGFVTNSAFDVHVQERGRERDLFTLFEAKQGSLQDKSLDPRQLLGIGIDQDTAIIVEGDRFQVSGPGKVYVFDPRQWTAGAALYFDSLIDGQSYHLRDRHRLEADRAN